MNLEDRVVDLLLFFYIYFFDLEPSNRAILWLYLAVGIDLEVKRINMLSTKFKRLFRRVFKNK